MNPNPLLVATNISKTFTIQKRTGLFQSATKNVEALKDFSLTIEEPMILGLIGPNGAGKTTFIKHCLGLVEKSTGELQVLGFNPYTGQPMTDITKMQHSNQDGIFHKMNRFLGGSYNKSPFLRQVGLVSGQKQNLDPNLSALDSLMLSGYLYDMRTEEIESQIKLLVNKFQIEDKIDVPVRQLSLGQKMKFEIISSVLHSPQFLFMDEPTLGLDFEAQSMMRSMLLELHRTKGLTILLTSHYLPDITMLCDRVVVIEKGQKVFEGSVDKLMQESESGGYLGTLVEELNKAS
jgi:ABC-2 type transport system ATP-binding protein